MKQCCNTCKHFKNNKRNNFNVVMDNVSCKNDMFEIYEGYDASGWVAWVDTENLKCDKYEPNEDNIKEKFINLVVTKAIENGIYLIGHLSIACDDLKASQSDFKDINVSRAIVEIVHRIEAQRKEV